MTIKTTVLRDVAMVMLNISIWSGAKKLQASDFINVNADDLPSNRVASFGIKHLIDKERLQPFKTIRGQTDRLCTKYGTRFLGGYAIPQDCVDQIGHELKALCDQFEQEIDRFMVEYDQATEDWISSNPDFSEPIRRAILPPAVVRSRFRASYSIFEVDAHPLDRTGSMETSQNDLLDSVLNGVVTTLKPHLERKAGANANSYRVEVRQTITDLAQKVRRFSFMEPSGGMKLLADDLEDAVNGSGKIKDAEYEHLWEIIKNFTSPEGVRAAITARASTAHQRKAKDQSKQKPRNPDQPLLGDLGFVSNKPAPAKDQGAVPADSQTEQSKTPSAFDLEFDLSFGAQAKASEKQEIEPAQKPQPAFEAVFDWN